MTGNPIPPPETLTNQSDQIAALPNAEFLLIGITT
jgi:hypothetical protein